MKKLLNRLFSRGVLVGAFIVLQVAALYWAATYLNDRFEYFYAASLLLAALFVLHIVSKDTNPAYKIAWILPILTLPVFGGLLYMVFGRNRLSTREQKRMHAVILQYRDALNHSGISPESISESDPDGARMSRYILHAAATPPFLHTQSTFLPTGEVYFEQLLAELAKAEKFIFLEYYIIEPGRLWDAIHAILVEKARQGVDVRVLYDDFGTMFRLPKDYARTLQSEGIRTHVFNRFIPALSSRFNNRDHRKIAVIDGNAGFTGGINLADRYANAGGYDGHWLDCGVMLRGEAVQALTAMFLSIWDYVSGMEDDFSDFTPDTALTAGIASDGCVQPFTDTPLDDEAAGETVYLQMINRAKSYVYINTPYLIIDNEMQVALTTAAKSGVDVRIVTPARSDSRIVQEMTRSYYDVLAAAGVRIYEYEPGMVHAKTFVSDDRYGVVGTINLDYRSLYLHYECAVWLSGCRAIADMKLAYLRELSDCRPVTLDACRAQSRFRRLYRALLRLLAPLF